jgi:hypothetical protein
MLLAFLTAMGPHPAGVGAWRENNAHISTLQDLSKAQDRGGFSSDFGRIPLYFIPNKGQMDGRALFAAPTREFILWITKKGLIFDRNVGVSESPDKKSNPSPPRRNVMELAFPGAVENPRVIPLEGTAHRTNFFIGKDPAAWKTNIMSFNAVLYENIYKDIDLKIYGNGSQVEYEWIVRPGGDPVDIRLEYRGVKKSFVDENGDLIIATESGGYVHKKPRGRQLISGKEISVRARFVRIATSVFGISVDPYDAAHSLVIDPVIFSTYLGGSLGDGPSQEGHAIAVDKEGCAYITGQTFSMDFPIKSAVQLRHDDSMGYNADVFVTKFAADGQSLVYSTYLGGKFGDIGKGISVDARGCAHITGYTWSFDFPLRGALQSSKKGTYGDFDAFLTKLAPAGSSLEYSTFLGGQDNEIAYGLALDKQGCAYVTGRTWSKDFPVKDAFQGTFGGVSDAFVAKFSLDGKQLVFSTFLGGKGWDVSHGIAIDTDGSCVITGFTDSLDFPLVRAYQAQMTGVCDAFVAKFASGGKSLVFSTYLGGTNNDRGYAVCLDGQGSVYVTGCTYSKNFPILNGCQKIYNGNGDVFLTKLSANGRTLKYSTYLGGSDWDLASGVAVDGNGDAFIAGLSYSENFPLANPLFPQKAGSADAFIATLNPHGNQLVFSSFFGGMKFDRIFGLALDMSGACYLTGFSYSDDFPVLNAFQGLKKGFWDIVFLKLSLNPGNLVSFGLPTYLLGHSSALKDTVSSTLHNLKDRDHQEARTQSRIRFSYDMRRLKWRDYRDWPWGTEYEEVGGSAMACGDIDNDGDIDIVMSSLTMAGDIHGSGNFPSNEIAVFVNDGHGYFRDETDQRLIPTDYYEAYRAVRLGDVDNDGDLDILLASHGVEYGFVSFLPGDQDRLLMNNGKGYFLERSSTRLPIEPNSFTHSIEFGDTDNDGDLDIYACRLGSNPPPPRTDEIWLNNGKGFYRIDRKNDFAERPITGGSAAATFGDLNNDGYQDIVAIGGGDKGDNIFILINDKRGAYNLLKKRPKNYPYSGGYQPVIADFNNDGWRDIFVANPGTNSHFNVPDLMLFNLGNLKFVNATAKLHQGNPPYASWHATAGDIDNDKDIDLFVAVLPNWDKGTPYEHSRFYENLGKGNFRNSSDMIPELTDAVQISLADVDKDGDKDIIICACTISKILINELIPTFEAPMNFRLLHNALGGFIGQEELEFSFCWEKNPINPYKVVRYRIYKLEDDQRTLVGELDSNTFEYHYNDTSRSARGGFSLHGVDGRGKESCAAFLYLN